MFLLLALSDPPIGLEDVSGFPNLLAELLEHGLSDRDVQKIAGLNVLRVMQEVERIAGVLQAQRLPSEELLEAAGRD
jgi:membrane dipeptidase